MIINGTYLISCLFGSGCGAVIVNNMIVISKLIKSRDEKRNEQLKDNVKMSQVWICTFIGIIIGMIISSVLTSFIITLESYWIRYILSGLIIGACVPTMMQLWALTIEFITFMNTGKGSCDLTLSEGIIDIMIISLKEYFLMDKVMILAFSLAGLFFSMFLATIKKIWEINH